MLFSLTVGALILGSIYGLIALGYSIIYRASGLMNFAQGELFMLGAFIGLTFYRYLQLPFLLSFVLTIIVMFLAGMLLERAVIRKILKKSNGEFIVLATIALSVLFKNFAMLVWGSKRLEFPSLFSVSSIEISGINIQPESILVVAATFIFMVLFWLFMNKTKFGTAMRSAAQDPLAARASGIDVSLTTGVTWGLSAAVSAIGGMLYGPVYGVTFGIGATIGMRGFAGAVIGGYGNMIGAVVGGLLLGFVETFAAGYIGSEYKDFVAYAVLILFMFLKPTGLFNERAIED